MAVVIGLLGLHRYDDTFPASLVGQVAAATRAAGDAARSVLAADAPPPSDREATACRARGGTAVQVPEPGGGIARRCAVTFDDASMK
ncbi:hypothetical protein MZTS_18415 [Methylorubrum zatmanii]|nr:hypothetical protein [Methylorubrum zatmanii]